MHGIAAYEALRAHVLGEAPIAFVPLGLAVLRRHGVAAWLAREAAARRLEVADRSTEEPRQDGRGGLGPSTSELVRLLAGTALLVMKARPR